MFTMPWDRIEMLKGELSKCKEERDDFHQRCKDLEDAIEKEYGVKVRTETTEVIVDFTKVELAVINVAICKLMEKPLSTDDAQFYVDLRLKIEDLLNKMKE